MNSRKRWACRCAALTIIALAGLRVLPWWFTLAAGIPLWLDAWAMLMAALTPEARE
jgi:hypothetical protein